MSEWTDERIEQLKTLWASGRSCSEIAAELGGISRSAVIGKVHRLELAGRRRIPVTMAEKLAKKRVREAKYRRANADRGLTARLKLLRYPSSQEAEKLTSDSLTKTAAACTFEGLTSTKCHWPYGDPRDADFCFCGQKTWGDLVYCGGHARMAYEPAKPRRRAA